MTTTFEQKRQRRQEQYQERRAQCIDLTYKIQSALDKHPDCNGSRLVSADMFFNAQQLQEVLDRLTKQGVTHETVQTT